jgi:hypothetical protein
MYRVSLAKPKLKKKRTAKSNGQKDYEERKSKLYNLDTSPIQSFKVTNCKTRVQSSNPQNTSKRLNGSYIRYNVRSKADSAQGVANIDVAKLHAFKIANKSTSKNKYKDRLSHSGSNKTGRHTAAQMMPKKRLKTTKGKQSKAKESAGGYICVPQFPNNMHAAKALLEFKNKLEKSSNSNYSK